MSTNMHNPETNMDFLPVWPEQWVSEVHPQVAFELTLLKEVATLLPNMALEEIKQPQLKTTNIRNKIQELSPLSLVLL
jgi:hypothetical protein